MQLYKQTKEGVMRKRLLIGFLGLILMMSWAPKADAGPIWIQLNGVWYKIGSLEVTTQWFVRTLNIRPAQYAITISPILASVQFENPAGALGGDASENFGNDVEITLPGIVNPALSGKKNIEDTIIFGACDDCTAEGVILPQDGALWLMFMNSENQCDTQNTYLKKINCVKDWLVAKYEPNSQWRAIYVRLLKFDSILRAWQDYNKDGAFEESAYVQTFNLTISDDGSYTSTDPNNCDWQYEPPSNVTGVCDAELNTSDPYCCDPEWNLCNPLTDVCL